MEKNDDWGALLGETSPLPKPDNLGAVIEKMLREPLNAGNISRSICTHCGFYSGIDDFCCQEMVRISEGLGEEPLPKPIDFGKVYFVTSYCEVCHKTRSHPLKIEIIPI